MDLNQETEAIRRAQIHIKRENNVLNQNRQKLSARKLMPILYLSISSLYIPISISNASTGLWQVFLGTQAQVCLAVALPPAETFSTTCPKWGLFSICI